MLYENKRKGKGGPGVQLNNGSARKDIQNVSKQKTL